MAGPRLVIRIDDVCPSMRMERLEQLAVGFDAAGVKPLLAVIPENANPGLLALGPPRSEYWSKIRDFVARGWTVGQHGYRHVGESKERGILGITPKSEFSGLSYEAQRSRVEAGREKLLIEGIGTEHFVPPYHSFDETTIAVLSDLGFRSISDGYGFWPYRRGNLVLVPQLLSSFRLLGRGVYTICLHPNEMSTSQIEQVLKAVATHADRFITYDQAVEMVRDGPGPALTRQISRIALTALRTIRGPANTGAAPGELVGSGEG